MANPEPTRVIYLCTANVCRSPLASAMAYALTSSLPRPAAPQILSRGLTDHYSAWGSGAEPRMIQAAKAFASSSFPWSAPLLSHLQQHQSALLTREEASDPNTFLFLVTSNHFDWVRDAVGGDVVDAAKAQGRLRLLDSKGGDVADPYFGDEKNYASVCQHILSETPLSLAKLLQERRILTPQAAASFIASSSSSTFADAALAGRVDGDRQTKYMRPDTDRDR